LEAIFIIIIKLVIGLIFLYLISKFVDMDVEQTDKKDDRFNLKDIRGNAEATALYASSLQKSKRKFYTIIIAVVVAVSFI